MLSQCRGIKDVLNVVAQDTIRKAVQKIEAWIDSRTIPLESALSPKEEVTRSMSADLTLIIKAIPCCLR
jgi:hypothetical protein